MYPECKNMQDIFELNGKRVDCIGIYRISEERLKPGERHKIFLGSYLELEDETKVILGYLVPNPEAEKLVGKKLKINGIIHKSIAPEDQHMQQVIAPHLKDYDGYTIIEE
ncbi:MAG: hypothetical protein PHV06_11990 [bacterium]|nr:hypothetical protein [bacterium]